MTLLTSTRFVGLMSGTSVDAIDAALIDLSGDVQLLASLEHPIPTALREEIQDLSHTGSDEIERMGRLDRKLGQLFGDAVIALLAEAGQSPTDIAAIGSHGQTLRHRPPSAGPGEHSFRGCTQLTRRISATTTPRISTPSLNTMGG